MGLFNLGKPKEPKPLSEKKKLKIIAKIKKNKLAINKLEAEAQMAPLSKGKTKKYLKLKEDNVKMAKELIIKNGRLEKVQSEGAPAPAQQNQTQAPPQAQPQREVPRAPMPPQGLPEAPNRQGGQQMTGEPALNAQMREAPQQAPPQQAPPQDEYIQMMQQQEAQQRAQQESLMRRKQQAFQAQQQAQQQAMAQAQAQAQAPQQAPPGFPQQPQQAPPQQRPGNPNAVVPVTIFLVENKKITTQIPETEIVDFINDIKEAVDNQRTMQIGDRFINGFHIIFYEIGN